MLLCSFERWTVLLEYFKLFTKKAHRYNQYCMCDVPSCSLHTDVLCFVDKAKATTWPVARLTAFSYGDVDTLIITVFSVRSREVF